MSVLRVLGLVWGLCAASAFGAVVRTLDGKTYEGEVRFEATGGENGSLLVTPAAGPAVRVDARDVLQATFPRAGGPALLPVGQGQWLRRDVGEVAAGMKIGTNGNHFVVTAGGVGVGAAKVQDGFGFMYQPLKGDGEITARVVGLGNFPMARAGVMIRQGLGGDSPSAAACFGHDAEGVAEFVTRTAAGGAAEAARMPRIKLRQCWLRLSRRENTFTASVSFDGSSWGQLGEPATFEMADDAYIGLFVTSCNKAQVVAGQFDNITLVSRAAPVTQSRPADLSFYGQGIVLRNGTALGGAVVRSADESAVRFAQPGKPDGTVAAKEVARIVLRTLTPDLRGKLGRGRGGVLLTRGEFFEGEFKGLDDGKVRLSSVLFGLRRFEAKDVAAVVLHDADVPHGRYVVRTADGTVLMADSLRAGKGELIVGKEGGGTVNVAGKDVYEITAGGERLTSLLDLKPPAVTPAPGRSGSESFTADGTTAGVAMAFAGAGPGTGVERGVGECAGASLTWQLGGEYRTMLCRAGVPRDVLPVSAVSFVVLADGKQVYRSEPRNSVDDPLTIAVALKGVKAITLRVETSAGEGGGVRGLAAGGLWADPVLVKE